MKRLFAVFGGSMALGLKAPKGRNSIAQGNALGIEMKEILSPERATPAGGCALSGLGFFAGISPRALPWALNLSPFQGSRSRQLPTKNSAEPQKAYFRSPACFALAAASRAARRSAISSATF